MTSSPPGTICAAGAIADDNTTTTKHCKDPQPAPTTVHVKADAAAGDVPFCSAFAESTTEFGSSQPAEQAGVDPQTSAAFVRRWKEVAASLDTLAPAEIAPVMHNINAAVQQAKDRKSSQASAADENTLSDWLIAHCGFNEYGQQREPNSNTVTTTVRNAKVPTDQSGAK